MPTKLLINIDVDDLDRGVAFLAASADNAILQDIAPSPPLLSRIRSARRATVRGTTRSSAACSAP